MKESGQRIEAGMQMALTLDIAAEAEVDRDQRHPRSISTPTPRAAGTAPGLVTRMRSQGMPRSPISTSARRSAKVSTNWKCDSRANSCTRSDNAA